MICHPFIAFEGVPFACTWLLMWTFPPKEKNQKRNNLNRGRIIAGLPKLHQFLLVALRSDNSPHYTVTTDHVCLRYLKSEAWPSKSRDITWTSSSGESWRGWCAVKIQGIDNLKERLRLCWAHISQHRVAKAIQAFTKRLKGCIADAVAALKSGLSEMRRWWRVWWDGDVLCTFYRSNEGYVAIKGWQNKVFSFVEIRLKSEHAKSSRLLVCSLWRRYLKGKTSVSTFIRQQIVRSFKCRIWHSRTAHRSWVIWLES